MKLWSGIITDRLAESKAFYTRLFGCKVLFDSDWFVLLELGGGELGLLAAGLEEQADVFRPASDGKGLWVVVDVDEVDATYERFLSMGIAITVPLRDEPWGDRHFVVRDPNGVPVDVVYRRP